MLQIEAGTLPTQQYVPKRNCMVSFAMATGTSWPPWNCAYVIL